MKRYVLHPGTVISRNDGDWHFITARQLIDLYRVRPSECRVYDPERADQEGEIHLHPRNDGNYTLPQ